MLIGGDGDDIRPLLKAVYVRSEAVLTLGQDEWHLSAGIALVILVQVFVRAAEKIYPGVFHILICASHVDDGFALLNGHQGISGPKSLGPEVLPQVVATHLVKLIRQVERNPAVGIAGLILPKIGPGRGEEIDPSAAQRLDVALVGSLEGNRDKGVIDDHGLGQGGGYGYSAALVLVAQVVCAEPRNPFSQRKGDLPIFAGPTF